LGSSIGTVGDGDMALLPSISNHIHGEFTIVSDVSHATWQAPHRGGLLVAQTLMKRANKVSDGTNRGSVSWWRPFETAGNAKRGKWCEICDVAPQWVQERFWSMLGPSSDPNRSSRMRQTEAGSCPRRGNLCGLQLESWSRNSSLR